MTDIEGHGVGRPARVPRLPDPLARLTDLEARVEKLQERVQSLEDGTSIEYKHPFERGKIE